MKKSIQKLKKFFRLESERGYDNKAVMGGLANILSSWELEAREDQLSEQIIQAVISRLRDYHQLSEESREVVLKGIWQRVNKDSKKTTETASKRKKEDKPSPLEKTPESKKVSEPSTEIIETKESIQEEERPEKQASPPVEKLDLETPIDSIKGIGVKKKSALERMGISLIHPRPNVYLPQAS